MQPNNTEKNNAKGPELEAAVREVVETEAKSVDTGAAKEDIVFSNVPKKNHGMLLGLIMCALLAVGGIGFGVWAMMDGNSQKEQLNKQITALNGQVSELQEKLENNTVDDYVVNEDENELIDEEATNEENGASGAYEVISIGDCIFDSGTSDGGASILKCEAKTSLGDGRFVYNSEDNELKFVVTTE